MVNRVLLVGLGQIGLGFDVALDPHLHIYTHARAMAMHPAFELVAAVDPVGERRALFERLYGTAAFGLLADVPDSAAPDLVIVASATGTHAEVIDEACNRFRPRAVLCEKPLAYLPAEARRLVATCEARGTALFVNFMRRADPAALEIKRRIHSGAIGTPVKGVAWYSKGLLHNGSHAFDLLGSWLGPVRDMRVLVAGRRLGREDIEPDLLVVFERGVVVFLAAREEAFSHNAIELIAGNGRLRYDAGGLRVEWQSVEPHATLPSYTVLAEPAESIPNDLNRYQWHVGDHLADALDGKAHALCTGHEAATALAQLHALLEAS